MVSVMGHFSQPPGFCFHPTDEVLFTHYLKSKVYGWPQPCNVISEADPYECEPWDLPVKPGRNGRYLKGYFFSPRKGECSSGSPKKGECSSGSRKIRATTVGYWKVTGEDRTISASSKILGIKKTLVFYRGCAHHEKKTNWRMHEYILDDCNSTSSNPVQQSYVLCKVFQKNIPKKCKHCCAASSQVEETGYPDGEHGKMASLDIHNIAQTKNDVNIIPDGTLQGQVMKEVPALQGNLVVTDSDDPKLYSKENGRIAQSVFSTQPQQFVDTNLEKGTSADEQKPMQDCNKDDDGIWHFQDTLVVEGDNSRFCSSLPAQHDLFLDVSDGDFIELNDLIMTPLEVDSDTDGQVTE